MTRWPVLSVQILFAVMSELSGMLQGPCNAGVGKQDVAHSYSSQRDCSTRLGLTKSIYKINDGYNQSYITGYTLRNSCEGLPMFFRHFPKCLCCLLKGQCTRNVWSPGLLMGPKLTDSISFKVLQASTATAWFLKFIHKKEKFKCFEPWQDIPDGRIWHLMFPSQMFNVTVVKCTGCLQTGRTKCSVLCARCSWTSCGPFPGGTTL
jgi:hypothetical protein